MSKINLSISITPVGPRLNPEKGQTFALQLSIGTSQDIKIGQMVRFLPWNWTSVAQLEVRAGIYDKDGKYTNATGVKAHLLGVQRNPEIRADGASKPELDRIKTILQSLETDTFWNPEISNTAIRKGHRLVEDLAYISTQSGNLAQELNLVHYFKLEGLPSIKSKEFMGIMVAPKIELTDTIKLAPQIPINSTDEFGMPKDGKDKDSLRVIKYKPQNQSWQGYTTVLEVQKKGSDFIYESDIINNRSLGLDFKDYWIRTMPLENNSLPVEKLEEVVEAAVNWPKRICDGQQRAKLGAKDDELIPDLWANFLSMSLAFGTLYKPKDWDKKSPEEKQALLKKEFTPVFATIGFSDSESKQAVKLLQEWWDSFLSPGVWTAPNDALLNWLRFQTYYGHHLFQYGDEEEQKLVRDPLNSKKLVFEFFPISGPLKGKGKEDFELSISEKKAEFKLLNGVATKWSDYEIEKDVKVIFKLETSDLSVSVTSFNNKVLAGRILDDVDLTLTGKTYSFFDTQFEVYAFPEITVLPDKSSLEFLAGSWAEAGIREGDLIGLYKDDDSFELKPTPQKKQGPFRVLNITSDNEIKISNLNLKDEKISGQRWAVMSFSRYTTDLYRTLIDNILDRPELVAEMLYYQFKYVFLNSEVKKLKEKWENMERSDNRNIVFGWLRGDSLRGPQSNNEERIAFSPKVMLQEAVEDFIIRNDSRLISSPDEVLRSEFITEFQSSFQKKLVPGGATQWPTINEVWEEYVDTFIGNLNLKNQSDKEGKPGGIGLILDNLMIDNPQDATGNWKKDEDAWREIAGFGVMVARKPDRETPLESLDWAIPSFSYLRKGEFEFGNYTVENSAGESTTVKCELIPHFNYLKFDADNGDEVSEFLFDLLYDDEDLDPNILRTSAKISLQKSTGDALLLTAIDSDSIRLKINGAQQVEIGSDSGTLELEVKINTELKEHLLRGMSLTDIYVSPALIPIRSVIRGTKGYRFPSVVYNQRQLVAPNPLADALKGEYDFDEPKVDFEPDLYQYAPVLSGPKWQRGVRLVYGEEYFIGAFMVDSAGGLPKLLQHLDAGIDQFIPYRLETDSNKWNDFPDPKGIFHSIEYKRRVPIGALRIQPVETNGATNPRLIDWPDIPQGVSLLAEEVNATNYTTISENDGISFNSKTIEAPKVVVHKLVRDKQRQFAFTLRPPDVDIDVFERWLEPTGSKHVRQEVYKGYFARMFEKKDNDLDNLPEWQLAYENPLDYSIDDPAIDTIQFELQTYDWKEQSWKLHQEIIASFKLQLNGAVEQAFKEQQHFIKVELNTHTGNTPKITAVGLNDIGGHDSTARLTIALPEEGNSNVEFSNVYRLRMRPQMLNTDKRKFDTQIVENLENLPCQDLIIEVPNEQGWWLGEDKTPGGEFLWKKFSASLGKDKASVDVNLDVDPNTPDKIKARIRNIDRCELIKQPWRWQGRPVPLPFKEEDSTKEDYTYWQMLKDKVNKKDAENEDDLLFWEIETFAELTDKFDSTTIPLNYSFQSEAVLHKDLGPQKDLRAQYLRYGLRVFSRYESIFEDHLPVTTVQPSRKGSLFGVGWDRVFVPYRGPIPSSPVIKAIVPLTTSHGRGLPTLLLVLDESAFGQCGITESIECRIELAKKGEGGPDLYELGADPILSIKKNVGWLDNGKQRYLAVKGPTGYTFDTDARQSLFARSNYEIVPPKIASSWDMAKISFRRLSGNKEIDLARNKTLDHDWTTAHWVRFLPGPLLVWKKDQNAAHGDALISTNEKSTISFPNLSSRIDVNYYDSIDQLKRFKYYLIVTRQVHEYRGFEDQEIYEKDYLLKEFKDKRCTIHNYSALDLLNNSYRGRMVEVQVAGVPGEAPGEDRTLGEVLFEQDPVTREPEGMITRVSSWFQIRPDS